MKSAGQHPGGLVVTVRYSLSLRFGFLACFVLVVAPFVGGCQERVRSDAPEEPVSSDEAVINALEAYDPIYQIDASGRVVKLKLEGRRIPGSVLDEVCKLTELNELSLYAASLTDDNLIKLQSLKNLRSLGLGATLITDKGLIHLEPLSRLQWIWLSRRLVPSQGVDDLKAAIPELTVFPQ
jgi:hypothetical protein